MIKTKFVIVIIITIGIVGAIVTYSIVPNENSQETISIPVEILTGEEYRDEQIRKTTTGNIHADLVLSTCGNDEHCSVDEIQKLSNSEKKETVLKVIDEVLDVYHESNLICHKYAHHIGLFLLGYSNGNITEAFTLATGKCGGALYHGIVENYFLSGVFFGKVNLENLQITNLCDVLSNDPQLIVRINCSHGIGHGLFKAYNFDIFSTVQKCDEFKTILERDACHKGVFMENQIQIFEEKGGVFDENDILYPCNIMDDETASACYHYHASYIMKKHQFSIEKSFSECDKIMPEKHIKACYYGIGLQTRGSSIHQGPSFFVSLCQTGEHDYHSYCIAGGAGLMAKQIGTAEALEFCDSVPEDFQVECYKAVGRIIHLNSASDKEILEECSLIEKSEHYDICVETNITERAEL